MALCEYCKKEFEPRRYRGKEAKRESRISRFCSKTCRGKGITNLGYNKPALRAIEKPTTMDIVLAAGWFEGEGCARRGGCTEVVSLAQKDEWVVKRLRNLFGGSIVRSLSMNYWRVSGPRARGFLMTIYKFVSPRRKEQILRAMLKSI